MFQINFKTSKNCFSRYKSNLWTMFELKYNVTKRECRELLKTLKKICFWLYKVQFIIEFDFNILILQLNLSAVILSETLMIRWLTLICLFDFNIRYVFKKRHIVIDELFRKCCESSNDINEIYKKNIDNFIDDQLNCVRIRTMRINQEDNKQFLKNEYSEKFQKITHYLIILIRLNHLNRKKFSKFKNWTLQFLVRNKYLFKQINKSVLLRKVINKTENQTVILKQFCNKNEHRERERTYQRVINKYWWRNLDRNCKKHVVNCKSCQLRAFNREKKSASFHLNFESVSKDKYWLCSLASIEIDKSTHCNKKQLDWMNEDSCFV